VFTPKIVAARDVALLRTIANILSRYPRLVSLCRAARTYIPAGTNPLQTSLAQVVVLVAAEAVGVVAWAWAWGVERP
jgi:hypothetical protein